MKFGYNDTFIRKNNNKSIRKIYKRYNRIFTGKPLKIPENHNNRKKYMKIKTQKEA